MPISRLHKFVRSYVQTFASLSESDDDCLGTGCRPTADPCNYLLKVELLHEQPLSDQLIAVTTCERSRQCNQWTSTDFFSNFKEVAVISPP